MKHKLSGDTDDLLAKIKKYISAGKVKISKHAILRQTQRDINISDILYVLSHGVHEENKTVFDVIFQTWKYAIRGKTLDSIDIRVIVAFADEMVIITVINITKEKHGK